MDRVAVKVKWLREFERWVSDRKVKKNASVFEFARRMETQEWETRGLALTLEEMEEPRTR